jgi:hypothetical protein
LPCFLKIPVPSARCQQHRRFPFFGKSRHTFLYNEEIAQLSADDLRRIDDNRAFRIAEALRKGLSIREIHAITKIDVWFIDKIKHLVKLTTASRAKN